MKNSRSRKAAKIAVKYPEIGGEREKVVVFEVALWTTET